LSLQLTYTIEKWRDSLIGGDFTVDIRHGVFKSLAFDETLNICQAV
jgi:hypothetical protein